MIGSTLFVSFVLGLRHGADPDHLAAIDNLTRNALNRRPSLGRFIGALFAGGHTMMVIAMAGLAGWLGVSLAARASFIESIGALLGVVVLAALAAGNIRGLARRESMAAGSYRLRLIPAPLRESAHPLAATLIGMLFGFGFETSSQITAYATAMTNGAGVWGALVVGACFCAGMIVTDTLDSAIVCRFVGDRRVAMTSARRVWILIMTLFALAVAAYNAARLLGRTPPIPEVAVSAVMVATLALAFLVLTLLAARQGRMRPEFGTPEP